MLVETSNNDVGVDKDAFRSVTTFVLIRLSAAKVSIECTMFFWRRDSLACVYVVPLTEILQHALLHFVVTDISPKNNQNVEKDKEK